MRCTTILCCCLLLTGCTDRIRSSTASVKGQVFHEPGRNQPILMPGTYSIQSFPNKQVAEAKSVKLYINDSYEISDINNDYLVTTDAAGKFAFNNLDVDYLISKDMLIFVNTNEKWVRVARFRTDPIIDKNVTIMIP